MFSEQNLIKSVTATSGSIRIEFPLSTTSSSSSIYIQIYPNLPSYFTAPSHTSSHVHSLSRCRKSLEQSPKWALILARNPNRDKVLLKSLLRASLCLARVEKLTRRIRSELQVVEPRDKVSQPTPQTAIIPPTSPPLCPMETCPQ